MNRLKKLREEERRKSIPTSLRNHFLLTSVSLLKNVMLLRQRILVSCFSSLIISYPSIEFKVTEITKKLGDMWKELSEEEKAVYYV